MTRRGDEGAISSALGKLRVATSKDDAGLRSQMAYGMFDTRGKVRALASKGSRACRVELGKQRTQHPLRMRRPTPSALLQVDPFDKDSPLKQASIEKFPPDMFFVLRVVQLLRGMANGARATRLAACRCLHHTPP